MNQAAPPSLQTLRTEIDRIDGQIHALLRARADVVTQVAAAKAAEASGAPAPAFRPAREADVLRSLAARHSGPFALESLVRIWREIISGMTRMQQEVVVAAHRPEKGDGAGWDAARDHFGLGMTYRPFRRARDVVAAVRDGEAGIGVLAAPGGEDEGEEPWWPALASDSSDLPRIVLKLPVLSSKAGRVRGQVALTLPGPEPEVADSAYLAVEAADGAPRDRVAAALADAGVVTRDLLAAPERPGLYLAEAESGWPAQVKDAAIRHITPIGGYPAPIG